MFWGTHFGKCCSKEQVSRTLGNSWWNLIWGWLKLKKEFILKILRWSMTHVGNSVTGTQEKPSQDVSLNICSILLSLYRPASFTSLDHVWGETQLLTALDSPSKSFTGKKLTFFQIKFNFRIPGKDLDWPTLGWVLSPGPINCGQHYIGSAFIQQVGNLDGARGKWCQFPEKWSVEQTKLCSQ